MARTRSIARLSVSVVANTRGFRRGMQSAKKQVSLFSVAAKAAAAAAATALVVGLKRAAQASEEFNAAMNNSLAIMGDVSKTMREDMSQAAIEVARTTQFSAKQAAESYFFLASAGLDAAQSIKALPTVSKFAQAGMFDMARATDLLTDAQSALGLTVKDPIENLRNMTRVADVLVKANTLANASVEQFSEALTTKAAAAARGFGIDLTEVVGVLGAFADQGVKGSEAGTAFNIVLRDLTTKALQNARAFRRFNVSVFDGAGEVRSFSKIIRDIENALDGMSDAQRKATLLQLGFTDKSVSFLQTLIGMSDRVEKYTEAVSNAGGTMEEVANKQLTPFKKGWEDLKSAFDDAATALQPLIDGFGELLDITASLVRGVKTLPENLMGITALERQIATGGRMQAHLEARIGLQQAGNQVGVSAGFAALDARAQAKENARRAARDARIVAERQRLGLEAITDPAEARREAERRRRLLKEQERTALFDRLRAELEAKEAEKRKREDEKKRRMEAAMEAAMLPLLGPGGARSIDLARTFIPGLSSAKPQNVEDKTNASLLRQLIRITERSGGGVAVVG